MTRSVLDTEGVWFDQAITGRGHSEIGIATTPERPFVLAESDSIASVQAAHRLRCDASRRTMSELALDDVVHGRGDRAVWALEIQVLREACSASRSCRHPA